MLRCTALVLCLALTATLLLSGCSGGITNTNNQVGTWTLAGFTLNQTAPTGATGSLTITSGTMTLLDPASAGAVPDASVQLTDNTGKAHSFLGSYVLAVGEVLATNLPGADGTLSFTATVSSGNVLTGQMVYTTSAGATYQGNFAAVSGL